MNLLADHLWQSTLFALVAGLLTLALRKNRARVRHWVWLAASLKFLIPVSVLIALGSHIEWRKAPAPSNISIVMVEVSQPFTAQPVAIETAPPVRFRRFCQAFGFADPLGFAVPGSFAGGGCGKRFWRGRLCRSEYR
jgi:hypothetical protein